MSNFQRAVTPDSKKGEDSLLSAYRALDETKRETLLDYAKKLVEEQSTDSTENERLLSFNRSIANAAKNRERTTFTK